MYWSALTAALRNNDMLKAREVDGIQTIPAVGRGGVKRSKASVSDANIYILPPSHRQIFRYGAVP